MLLALTLLSKATVKVCNTLTTTLEYPIAYKKTPYILERTGSLFLAEGGNSTRIFLLITCYLVLEIYGRNN